MPYHRPARAGILPLTTGRGWTVKRQHSHINEGVGAAWLDLGVPYVPRCEAHAQRPCALKRLGMPEVSKTSAHTEGTIAVQLLTDLRAIPSVEVDSSPVGLALPLQELKPITASRCYDPWQAPALPMRARTSARTVLQLASTGAQRQAASSAHLLGTAAARG